MGNSPSIPAHAYSTSSSEGKITLVYEDTPALVPRPNTYQVSGVLIFVHITLIGLFSPLLLSTFAFCLPGFGNTGIWDLLGSEILGGRLSSEGSISASFI